jgi:hypothetical protein
MSENQMKVIIDVDTEKAQIKLKDLGSQFKKAFSPEYVMATDRGGILSIATKTADEVNDSISNTFNSLKNGIGTLSTGIATTFAQLYVSVKMFNKALDETEEGLLYILGTQTNKIFLNQALDIQTATGGMIKYSQSINMARQASGLLTKDQLNSMSKLSALLEMKNPGKVDITALFNAIERAYTTGGKTIARGIATNDMQLMAAINKAMLGHKEDSLIGRQQIVMREINNELKRSMEETGNIFDNQMTKILGFVRSVKEQSKGVMEVITGIGTAIAAVFAPMAMGVVGGFALGPIGGAIAMATGAIISGTLLFIINNLLQEARHGDGKENITEKISSRITIYQDYLSAVFSGFMNKAFSAKEEKALLLKAYPELSGKSADEMAKAFHDMIEPFYNFGKFLGKVSDATSLFATCILIAIEPLITFGDIMFHLVKAFMQALTGSPLDAAKTFWNEATTGASTRSYAREEEGKKDLRKALDYLLEKDKKENPKPGEEPGQAGKGKKKLTPAEEEVDGTNTEATGTTRAVVSALGKTVLGAKATVEGIEKVGDKLDKIAGLLSQLILGKTLED